MAAEAITQSKGQVSFLYGVVSCDNLIKENAITYDIGQNGDTVSSLRSVIHLFEDGGSIVSTITVTMPKNSPEILALEALILTRTPYPLLIRDKGLSITVGMASAACSQIALSDTTGDSTVESISYSFKGNLFKAEI